MHGNSASNHACNSISNMLKISTKELITNGATWSIKLNCTRLAIKQAKIDQPTDPAC
jgi:hypothetical protein